MRRTAVLWTLLTSITTTQVAYAGALAPSRASDVVTLMSSSGTCGVGVGQVVDRRILADGSNVPFSIPAGKVLVVTGIDFSVDPSPMDFVIVGLSHGLTGWGVFGTSATAGTLGPPQFSFPQAAGHAAVPNVIFKSGSQVCADFSNGILPSPIGTMHVQGFLAQDR